MIAENVEYSDGTSTFEGFLAYDDSTTQAKPIVLVVHDWSGCRDFVKDKARYFAQQGYVGFAVDLYGKGQRGSSTDQTINQKLMQPLMENRELIVSRLNVAIELVKEYPATNGSKISAIGFCLGGLCVLDLARSGANIAGVVSIHGLLFPPSNTSNQQVASKILVLHGHEDKMVPPIQVQDFQEEMTKLSADWQVHTFGKSMHAFTNPDANSPKFEPEGNPPSFGVQYNKNADSRSWGLVEQFLAEIF